MVKRESEEYNHFLKVIDYFNDIFEKEGLLGKAYYIENSGFFYYANLGSKLKEMECDLEELFGDYDSEYDSAHKLTIIAEPIDDEEIDIYEDLEEFLIDLCSDYRDARWAKILREEGHEAATKFAESTENDEIIKSVREELQM